MLSIIVRAIAHDSQHQAEGSRGMPAAVDSCPHTASSMKKMKRQVFEKNVNYRNVQHIQSPTTESRSRCIL